MKRNRRAHRIAGRAGWERDGEATAGVARKSQLYGDIRCSRARGERMSGRACDLVGSSGGALGHGKTMTNPGRSASVLTQVEFIRSVRGRTVDVDEVEQNEALAGVSVARADIDGDRDIDRFDRADASRALLAPDDVVVPTVDERSRAPAVVSRPEGLDRDVAEVRRAVAMRSDLRPTTSQRTAAPPGSAEARNGTELPMRRAIYVVEGQARQFEADPTSTRTGGSSASAEPLSDRRYLEATSGPAAMARALSEEGGLTEVQRRALITRVVQSPTEFRSLLDRTNSGGIDEYTRDREVIARAVHDAHAAGAVSDEDVAHLMRFVGDGEDARRTVQLLAHDQRSTARGGVLEAAGLAARRLAEENPDQAGYRTARLLALTSSSDLADRHYPEGRARTEAFEEVNRLLREDRRFAPTEPRDGPPYPNSRLDADLFGARQLAMASWLRLAPQGTSAEDVRTQIETLGSSRNGLVRFLRGPGDGDVDRNSPLQRVIAATAGRDEHRTLNAMAIASDPALLRTHAPTDEALYGIFEVLTDDLENGGQALEFANRRGYQPSVNQGAFAGIANIVGHRGEDLFNAIFADENTRPARARTLESALSRTLFTLSARPDERDLMSEGIASFVENRVYNVGEDAPTSGLQVGHLLGAVHNSADLAVTRASRSDVRSFAYNVFGRTLGKVAGALVGRWGVVVDPLLNTGSRPEVDRRRVEAEAAADFVARYEQSGGSIGESGAQLNAAISQQIAERTQRLNAIINDPPSNLTAEDLRVLNNLRSQLIQFSTWRSDGYSQAREGRQTAGGD